jgi:MFS family permease
MIIATIIENISVDTLFAKNLPKETRAILNGCYSMAGNLGLLLFSLASGWLVDNVGPKAPFALIGLLDIIFGGCVAIF